MKHNLLTVNEAAKLKGVSRAAVYSAITRNRLPCRRVLGRIAVREADVLAWTALGYQGGRPQGTAMSEEAKARISQAQKRRWAERKRQETNKPTTKRPTR